MSNQSNPLNNPVSEENRAETTAAPEGAADGNVTINPRETSEAGDAPGTIQISGQELAELQTQAAKAGENWDRYVRQLAEFDNFRKRVARERQDATKFANQSLLEKLLPVLDNFEAALTSQAPDAAGSLDSFRTGMSMIFSQVKSVLTEAGLEELDATGQRFDPNFHEAVSQQESDQVEEGDVLQMVRKGYRLRDRLIRPASVVVAKKPAGQA